MATDSEQGGPGPATDRNNAPVVDPSRNVLDLVEAAIKRQDDLRQAEADHVREIMRMQAAHDHELRLAETARIDAIRAVDVGAVNRAAEVAATQATTLATQVAVSAETLRTQVAATASAGAAALSAALQPILESVADLRRAQYEAQGQKSTVIESRAASGNVGLWVGVAVVVLFGVLSFAVGVAGIYAALNR